MGLCYANPPFCQLSKVLTKVALEGARVVLCTPDPGTRRGTRLLEALVGPHDNGED